VTAGPPVAPRLGFARRAVEAKRSAIRVIFDKAQDQEDLIRLEIGEPSFVTPTHIVDAAHAAARDGWTRYGPNGGLVSLRERLVDRLERVDGIRSHPDEVVVTPGGMNALFSIYFALLEPGDEVLLPTPGFPNMDEMVRLLGGQPVFYPLTAANGYLPDVDDIGARVTPRTRVLFVNSPGNPTGAVFPPALVQQLVELADRSGIWLLSDEVYDELLLEDGICHTSARTFDTDGRVVTVFSFSKVYAMTGWRVGYCVAPVELATLLRKLQEPQVSCPSTVSQKAAEAALDGPRAPIEAMRIAYRDRLRLADRVMTEVGFEGHRSAATIYQVLDVSRARMDPMDLAVRLLDECRVAVAPGSVFGPGGAGLVRISLAAEPDAIETGIRRIARAVDTWATRP